MLCDRRWRRADSLTGNAAFGRGGDGGADVAGVAFVEGQTWRKRCGWCWGSSPPRRVRGKGQGGWDGMQSLSFTAVHTVRTERDALQKGQRLGNALSLPILGIEKRLLKIFSHICSIYIYHSTVITDRPLTDRRFALVDKTCSATNNLIIFLYLAIPAL